MYTLSVYLTKATAVMKATFLDLRKKSKEIVRALDRNQPVTLSYRGKVKGVIVPASQPREGAPSVRTHPAFGMWKDRADLKDVRSVIDRLRRARHAL